MSDWRSPRFEHDCEACVFLGGYGKYDLYWCSHYAVDATVVARWGDDGPEYASGIEFAGSHPALGMALRRANELGLTRVSV